MASVARDDVGEFLKLAAETPIHLPIQVYKLEAANQALQELRERRIRGAKVLKMEGK